jgi:quercetin dioxygenase-like cupin family protein
MRERDVATIINLNAELAKLKMLSARTPQTTRAEREGSSARLTPYRDGAIFAIKSAGRGAWERHPEGDELVHVVDGAATLHIVTEEGRQSFAIKAGMLAIVPRGAWHRFDYPDGVTLMTATPGASEYVRLDVDDPRTVEAQRN